MPVTDKKYLNLLSRQFPTAADTLTEIINLEAIMNLPKATEHFVSDLHGQYDSVSHVLRNGSGNVKEKIREVFQDRLSDEEVSRLATIVYYPNRKVKSILKKKTTEEERYEFFKDTITNIVELGGFVVSKYTRSKVRKAMPDDMSYIMEELLFKDSILSNKEEYYDKIIDTVIELGAAPRLITAFAYLIQELIVDHLHVLGDIYDRGPEPDRIMDLLMSKRSVDICWGNHDVIWMGAACGSKLLIANVLRICARYYNLDIVEDAYGISLRPLVTFAETIYKDADYAPYYPKIATTSESIYEEEAEQAALMHMAIAIIQFKLEGPIIERHPEFEMDDRLVLNNINYDDLTIDIGGKTYKLNHADFPTIDPDDPYKLSDEEEYVMDKLAQSFQISDRLNKHVAFLYSKGAMYHVYNDNLLYHGCIPLTEDGKDFLSMKIGAREYKGKALFEKFEDYMRKAYAYRHDENRREYYLDFIWYLWQGKASPLFGKHSMTTFERYYVEEKETHTEIRNPYYELRDSREIVVKLMEEFDVDSTLGHIVNGHTPVKERKGENPVKAGGKMLVIDGGFSKAYQPTTGLAGYTLLYNSFGMQLVSHQPFTSIEEAIEDEIDIVSTRRVVDRELERQTVRDTDIGTELKDQIKELKQLLIAYQSGLIAETVKKK